MDFVFLEELQIFFVLFFVICRRDEYFLSSMGLRSSPINPLLFVLSNNALIISVGYVRLKNNPSRTRNKVKCQGNQSMFGGNTEHLQSSEPSLKC